MTKKLMTTAVNNSYYNTREYYTITTEKYLVQLTGGSIKFYDRAANRLLATIRGFSYLYTGAVKPDETELMALEKGKHFYIFSLDDFQQRKKVTIPYGCWSMDVLGAFSDDGKVLHIPVIKRDRKGVKSFFICHYTTDEYTLIRMDPISYKEYQAKWEWISRAFRLSKTCNIVPNV